MERFLSKKERKDLRRQHRRESERRYADRIKALLLWDKGWTLEEISEALLLDESTIRRYRRFYESDGMDRLLDDDWGGSERRLSEEEERELVAHLDEHLCSTTSEVSEYIIERFGVEYSVRGVRHVLSRLGFVYKKTKAVPGKADAKKQQAFVKRYRQLKAKKDAQDPIYFVDGTHPVHNSQPANGWILRGKAKQIQSNTGRKRVNLNGALNVETLRVIVREDPSVNAQSTVSLLKQLEKLHPKAKKIYVILDNARYYRSVLVRKHVQNSKIKLLFLPPYAPNLNLIERLWKFFKKKVLANRYYESFLEFQEACRHFFKTLPRLTDELKTLLVDNFQIIHPT
ncbi:IS630 family transposase, partial [Oligoflexia bacterium]|nr:IS630 family transposase [Oligoflexia bacterium]